MKIIDQLLGPLRRPIVTTKYPAARPELEARRSRGTPARANEACMDDRACEEICPTDAITIAEAGEASDWRLDYGKCIFCGECVRVCATGAITATADFELATRSRASAIASASIPQSDSK